MSRKSVVRLTDRPDMTLDVYRGGKTTKQQTTCLSNSHSVLILLNALGHFCLQKGELFRACSVVNQPLTGEATTAFVSLFSRGHL